jgi:hypothetical protein
VMDGVNGVGETACAKRQGQVAALGVQGGERPLAELKGRGSQKLTIVTTKLPRCYPPYRGIARCPIPPVVASPPSAEYLRSSAPVATSSAKQRTNGWARGTSLAEGVKRATCGPPQWLSCQQLFGRLLKAVGTTYR